MYRAACIYAVGCAACTKPIKQYVHAQEWYVCRKSVSPIPSSQTWQEKLRCGYKQLPFCLLLAFVTIQVSVICSHAQNMCDTATALYISVTAGVKYFLATPCFRVTLLWQLEQRTPCTDV